MLASLEIAFPGSVEEASSLVLAAGDDAQLYAGGAELAVLLRYGLASCRYLVDLNRIAGLSAVRTLGESLIGIGALANHQDLSNDPLVVSKLPALALAESRIGNVRIRNQGTIGGNVCFADPSSDPTAPLLLYDAELELASASGTRTVRLAEFVHGPYQTAIRAGEVLTEIRAHPLPPGWHECYLRIERFTRPTAGVAVACRTEGGCIAEARLAVAAATTRPKRLDELEQDLVGRAPDEAVRLLVESTPLLEGLLQPTADLLGSPEYKLHVVQVLLTRGIRSCTGWEAR